MTDYPLAVATIPTQYAVTISQPDAAWVQAAYTLAGENPMFVAWLEPDDYTSLPIVGVRFEVEVLSGSGSISWLVTFDEDGTPDNGLGNRNFYSGVADVSVSGGDDLSWPMDATTYVPFAVPPPSPTDMMQRLAVTGLPDPSNVSFEVEQMSGGPLTLRARLVAFTIDSIPPRRLLPDMAGSRRRLWPPPTSMQDSPGGIGNHL
jgi:hypothetical protein